VRITLRCLAAVVWVVLASRSYAATDRVLSAQSDAIGHAIDSEGACQIEASPRIVHLKVGHVHEVAVSGPGSSFRWEVRDPKIATVQVADQSGRRAFITGHGLGETELIISTANGQEAAKLIIRGISRRYTIVAWIDGSRIHLEEMAANAALKRVLSVGCSAEVALWRFGFQGEVDSPADVRYAKAFLVRAASNETPPRQLTERLFQDKTAYKLWNDFQVDSRGAVAQLRSEVGNTPFPCDPQLPVGWEGELHPENGKAAWNSSQTMHSLINEARIGKAARAVERTLDPTGHGTPWIWSVLGFDKRGAASLDVQLFPTFWVYRDGVFCGSRKQADLARFVTGVTPRELKRSDLDRYEQTDWSEPCTEK
jgi:hypothetical protein